MKTAGTGGEARLPEKVLSRKEVLLFLGISDSTLARWDAAGLGPPAFRRGRIILYRESALLDWLDDNTTAAQSAAAGVRAA